MDDDAPPLPPSLADRLSAPLASWDDPVNAVHDRLNAALPWLWWPLSAPQRSERLDLPRHALYAVHAAVGVGGVALLRRRPGGALAVGALIALGSWAVFSGAWDRRADRLAEDDWDAWDAG